MTTKQAFRFFSSIGVSVYRLNPRRLDYQDYTRIDREYLLYHPDDRRYMFTDSLIALYRSLKDLPRPVWFFLAPDYPFWTSCSSVDEIMAVHDKYDNGYNAKYIFFD